jgi:uncharacterized membrane protein YbhN (UPF0104 family)
VTQTQEPLAVPATSAIAAESVEPRGKRRVLRGLLGVVVSLVSLSAVILWALDQDTPRFPTRAGDLMLIGVAVLVYAVATIARGWRWHGVLRQGNVAHRRVDAYSLVAVGYMGNTVLPARGGEVLRILLMAERSDARRRTLLGSVLSERTLDAGTLILLLATLTIAGVAGNPAGTATGLAALGALVAAAVGLWGYLRLRRRGYFERLAGFIRPVVGAAKPLLGRPGIVLALCTLFIWGLETVVFWLVAAALGLDIALVDACLLLVLTAFFSLIPAAPGYVGTFDAAVVFGLKAIGITGGVAVSYALLVRFVLFVPITIAGLVLLMGRYGGVRQLWRPSAE